MLISQGPVRDEVVITIKNPNFFVSAETGQTIDLSERVIRQTIPRQLPRGADVKALEQAADWAAKILGIFAAVHIIVVWYLKGSMQDLLMCFYCL